MTTVVFEPMRKQTHSAIFAARHCSEQHERLQELASSVNSVETCASFSCALFQQSAISGESICHPVEEGDDSGCVKVEHLGKSELAITESIEA